MDLYDHLLAMWQAMTPSFSDDDLKRLKEVLYHSYPSITEGEHRQMGCCTLCEETESIKALLARLEAAELIVKALEPILEPSCSGQKMLEAWRKSKGIDTESLKEWNRKSDGKREGSNE